MIERNGRRLLSFSCNDYLNLTQHPALKRAAIDADGAIRRRLRRLAARHRQSSAVCGTGGPAGPPQGRRKLPVVFGSGYLANAGIIPALIGERRPRADR